MSTELSIKHTCPICKGSLIYSRLVPTYEQGEAWVLSEGPCLCTETETPGYEVFDRVALPTNVFYSYMILEELDATEHNALTDTQKDGVLHLLACGKVDLNTGKAGRVRLWNWFGAESTTVANLTALLE